MKNLCSLESTVFMTPLNSLEEENDTRPLVQLAAISLFIFLVARDYNFIVYLRNENVPSSSFPN